MNAFGLPMTCADCAGPLTLVNAAACTSGTRSIAVLECGSCTSQWEVEILLRRHRRTQFKNRGLRVAG